MEDIDVGLVCLSSFYYSLLHTTEIDQDNERPNSMRGPSGLPIRRFFVRENSPCMRQEAVGDRARVCRPAVQVSRSSWKRLVVHPL
jgi:hypothetical protein